MKMTIIPKLQFGKEPQLQTWGSYGEAWRTSWNATLAATPSYYVDNYTNALLYDPWSDAIPERFWRVRLVSSLRSSISNYRGKRELVMPFSIYIQDRTFGFDPELGTFPRAFWRTLTPELSCSVRIPLVQ